MLENFAQKDICDDLTKQDVLSNIKSKKIKEQIPLLENAVRELEEIQRQLQEVKGKEKNVD